jgi:hypothetical protein
MTPAFERMRPKIPLSATGGALPASQNWSAPAALWHSEGLAVPSPRTVEVSTRRFRAISTFVTDPFTCFRARGRHGTAPCRPSRESRYRAVLRPSEICPTSRNIEWTSPTRDLDRERELLETVGLAVPVPCDSEAPAAFRAGRAIAAEPSLAACRRIVSDPSEVPSCACAGDAIERLIGFRSDAPRAARRR